MKKSVYPVVLLGCLLVIPFDLLLLKPMMQLWSRRARREMVAKKMSGQSRSRAPD
jgi:hypothetical protein